MIKDLHLKFLFVMFNLGGDVVLNCTIKDGKEYPILWMRLGGKREPFPISTGPSLLIHDKRFRFYLKICFHIKY